MRCPFCQALDTKVIDSRLHAEGSQIRRRRVCQIVDSDSLLMRPRSL